LLNIIIIEGVRYVYSHILLYCPIVETQKKSTKHGLTLVLQGMSERCRILFETKEERDLKLKELDKYFGLESTPNQNISKPDLSFLEIEANKSGFLLC